MLTSSSKIKLVLFLVKHRAQLARGSEIIHPFATVCWEYLALESKNPSQTRAARALKAF